MDWNVIDLKLIEAYTVVVLAERLDINEVPEKYREEVKIRQAEKTIEVLSKREDI